MSRLRRLFPLGRVVADLAAPTSRSNGKKGELPSSRRSRELIVGIWTVGRDVGPIARLRLGSHLSAVALGADHAIASAVLGLIELGIRAIEKGAWALPGDILGDAERCRYLFDRLTVGNECKLA